MFNSQTELDRLNSLTKYPSIDAYHKLGERGRLLPEVQVDFGASEAIMTEKVNGANGRIILCPNGMYILGSREELLYAKGDLIIHGNPIDLAIIHTLKPIAERLPTWSDRLTVVFGEVYGGTMGGKVAKQYTDSETTFGFRVFDYFSLADVSMHLSRPIEEIALWRTKGGQSFASPEDIEAFAEGHKLEKVPVVGTGILPSSLEDTYALAKEKVYTSGCLLDASGKGRAEGMVVRTKDRTKIAKIRIEEYERTLGIRG